jgi:hypothetical protein
MAKVVNLNKFRKRKRKEDAAKQAETNRRLHGRTKAERERERVERQKLDSTLDGAFMRPQGDEQEDRD